MKELLRKLKSLRHRFVYKIFFAYLLFWLIAFLLIITMIWYYWSEKEIRQSISSYSDILQQNSAYLNFTMHEVKGVVDTITNAESAETALNEGEKYYSENIESWNIVTSKGYRQIRYTLFTSNSITDILLHKKSGILSIENSEFYTKMTSAQQIQLSREIAEMEKYFLWFPMKAADQPDEPVESALYIRKIIDRNRLGNYIGYAVARVPYRVFQDIMGQTEVTSHSDKLLYTDDGDVIVGNSAPLLSGQQVEELVAQGSLERDGVMHRLRLDGKDYLIGSDDMEESGWHLALIIPYEDINENITDSLRFLIVFMLLVTILSLPFIYKMSSSLTGRIGRLKQEMENMESGNPEPGNVEVGNPELGNPGTGNLEAGNIEPEDAKSDNKESRLVRKLSGIMGGSDEIDDLTRTFYEMKRQNKQLMQEQYQNGIEIKDLELQVLQAQINPHFLYNTLETVYWMGVKNKAPEIQSIAQKMGSFYRLSLSNGNQVVSLKAELQQVQDYTDIQNMRFGNRIHLEICVPEELLAARLLKLTLQPLVENSINHGIRETEQESGMITISAKISEQDLLITIEDDGVGMDQEQLSKMMRRNTTIIGHGYGVWNINERLRRNYGDPYGLQYESSPGEGTCVTIRIPADLPELG